MTERLRLFFTELESEVLKLVEEYEFLVIKMHGLVDKLIADSFDDYYEIITKYNNKAWEYGEVSTSLLVSHAEVSNKWFSLKANIVVDTGDLYKPSTRVNEILSVRNFQASEKTIQRVNGNINQVLQNSYNEGWGVPKTVTNLKNEFNKLKTWEANRIARTEINSAKNTAAYQQLLEDNIEYHQWWSASDNHVRDSHSEMHGLITAVGNPFPNGLLYPGDRSGPISEWINCRCTPLAFIVPYDMMVPPGMSVFRESDLILIDDSIHDKQSTNPEGYDLLSDSEKIEWDQYMKMVDEGKMDKNQGLIRQLEDKMNDLSKPKYIKFSDNGKHLLDDLDDIYKLPKNITKKEIDAAKLYSEEGYKPINAYNRRVPNYKDVLKEHNVSEANVKSFNKHLDKLTSRMSLEENTVLYRGEKGLHFDPKQGNVYKWDSFTSTSFDKRIGHQFSREEYIYKIHAPKGTKGVYMNSNPTKTQLSIAADEAEWLLPRNTEFKVLNFNKNEKIIEILLL
jgi:SPP1 gp7 family putative phage head morphogenesis protein